MIKMENDGNWLIIRIPRMYADKVHDISCGRIVGEAIRLLEDHSIEIEQDTNVRDAMYANLEELQAIKAAVDAFSSAVREGFQLEKNAKQQTPS